MSVTSRSGLFYFPFSLRPLDFLDRVAEIMDILETSVNRGKPDVGNLVELVEFLHHHFADLARGDFALARTEKFLHNIINRRVDLLRGHRPLVQRSHKARQELVAAELCAVTILFYNLGQTQLHGFISGEAFVALHASAAAAYPVAFLRYTRVDYTGVIRVAEWTFHVLT